MRHPSNQRTKGILWCADPGRIFRMCNVTRKNGKERSDSVTDALWFGVCNFYADVESIRVDLMERSVDSFRLAYKTQNDCFSPKVVVVSEHLNFRDLPWYVSVMFCHRLS